MPASPHQLLVLPDRYAMCRLEPGAPFPPWPFAGDLFAVVRTSEELSVLCPEEAVPPGTRCEPGWRCLRVAGTLEFGTIGVLAALTAPLVQAGVSVLAVSTFDTDYLLVKQGQLESALAALRRRGHQV